MPKDVVPWEIPADVHFVILNAEPIDERRRMLAEWHLVWKWSVLPDQLKGLWTRPSFSACQYVVHSVLWENTFFFSAPFCLNSTKLKILTQMWE